MASRCISGFLEYFLTLLLPLHVIRTQVGSVEHTDVVGGEAAALTDVVSQQIKIYPEDKKISVRKHPILCLEKWGKACGSSLYTLCEKGARFGD